MKSVYKDEEIEVFSDKEVDKAEGKFLIFTDGSKVDLQNHVSYNFGSGDIKITRLKSKSEDKISRISKTDKYDVKDNIALSGSILYFKIIEHDEPYIEVEETGTEQFISETHIYERGDTLEIETPKDDSKMHFGVVILGGRNSKQNPEYGELIIKTPRFKNLSIHSAGIGKGTVDIPLSSLDVKISGSSDINCKDVEKLNAHISGSGKLTADRLTDICNVKISGSGDVNINSGELKKLCLSISGSGSIKANVTADTADFSVSGSGTICVNQVKKILSERCSGSGKIKIANRG